MAQQSLSTNDKALGNILEALANLDAASNGYESVASGIRGHDENYYIKPNNRTFAQMAEIAAAAAAEEKEIAEFSNDFNFRPWDGANAVARTLFDQFGHPGFGKRIQTMFGVIEPQVKQIDVDHTGRKIGVPWGDLWVPEFQAVFSLGSTFSTNYGRVFSLSVKAPKKMERSIRGFFQLIELYLKEHSIYKGKAFREQEMPTFIDEYKQDRGSVIYTKSVEHQLTGLLWNPIQYADRARQRGLSLKRSILLAGPYGTGKSLTGLVTAQVATANGWTYIECRPGDDLDEVMQAARLYQPAVVFYEDIDNITDSNDKATVQKLLDVFDGISAKGTEIICVMTTNHLDTIHKGMLRPGRMDGIILIEGLDPDGCIRMVKNISKDRMSPDVDIELVGETMAAMEPAFVKESTQRADWFNLDKENPILETEDYLGGAESMRFQWELYGGAREIKAKPVLDTIFSEIATAGLSDLIETGHVRLNTSDYRLEMVKDQ